MVIKTVLAFCATISAISCGNILFLNGVASPSHHLWNRVLARGLAAKGYNITMVSVDNDKSPHPNIHYVFLEATYDTVYGEHGSFDLLELADEKGLTAIAGVYEWCELCCDGILGSKGLDTILNYPGDFKFDAVLYDFTCGPCLLPLIHKFNYPPLVSVSAFNNPPYTHHLIGGHKYPSLVPHYVTNFEPNMNFFQRMFNSFLYAGETFYRQHIMIPSIDKKVRKRFNFANLPSIDELEKKTALLLVNSDNAVEYPEPLQPNMIQVGGLQITEPKQLPEEILDFIATGKRGTVLMSLGTNMKSNMLGKAMLSGILEAFAQLTDYNFIWKFESEPHELPIAPAKNIYIAKFLPQNDILAHPDVKAFITHSGLLSTQEALWYGKPMVAIPFFCDQERCCDKSVRMGLAVKIDFRTFNRNEFKSAILSVLENPKFAEKSKETSKLLQDKPQRPLEVALWWIEYVIRNPSAAHLKSQSIRLGWFASSSYDIILSVILTFHLFVYLSFKVFKLVKNVFVKSESKKLKSN